MAIIEHNAPQPNGLLESAAEGIHHPGLFHQWAMAPLLAQTGKVTLSMRVSNLVIGKMRIVVRDAVHHDLCSGGMGDGVAALSTGEQDIAWDFAPERLERPRYVICNLWAEYNGDDERTFEIALTLAQDDLRWTCRIPATMHQGDRVMHMTSESDYVFIGAPA